MARRNTRKRSDSADRLIGYVRVSSAEQVREGVSLDAQRERLQAYAVAHGAQLIGIEADEGLSGKLGPNKRPGLLKALQRVRSGDANGIVALKLDRFSRSTRDVLDLVDETRRDGWRLISVSEHLDTGSAAGRLVVTVLSALSEMEREQIGERTAEALAHVGRQGRIRSRIAPFGYRLQSGGYVARVAGAREGLVEDAGEQRIRSCIVGLHAEGLGARRIAAVLNTSGDVNPRTGRAWHPATLQSLLATIERRADL
jgi:DNA invertase Pin-like site-specific DNA recombinase